MTVFAAENVLVGWVERVVLSDRIVVEEVEGESGEDAVVEIYPRLSYLYLMEQKYRYIYNAQILRESSRLGIEHLNFSSLNKHKLSHLNIHSRLASCF